MTFYLKPFTNKKIAKSLEVSRKRTDFWKSLLFGGLEGGSYAPYICSFFRVRRLKKFEDHKHRRRWQVFGENRGLQVFANVMPFSNRSWRVKGYYCFYFFFIILCSPIPLRPFVIISQWVYWFYFDLNIRVYKAN